MTSTPPTTEVSPRTSVEKRTSIAWTNLPEIPASEARRQSPLTTLASPAPGTSPVAGFLLSGSGSGSGSGSVSVRTGRSLSSPPPPPVFLKRISFDTFDNKDASDFSLTLKSKHRDYSYTRRSRTFLCGTDQNDYSEFALEWLIDELVDDGDEIVCLRVVDKDSKISSDAALQERLYRQEATKLLDQIIEKNEEEKAISIILEFAVGKVHETIQRMIHIYEPVILIVGTRGRSLGGLQGLLPGSVSKYCLQHSPVPVIVVRPSSKRDKKKAKRRADPGRRIYQDIMQSSGIMIHGNNLAGNTEGTSNISLNSSYEPNGNEGVSPKTIGPMNTSGTPSAGSLTLYPGSIADTGAFKDSSNSSLNVSPRTSTENDKDKILE